MACPVLPQFFVSSTWLAHYSIPSKVRFKKIRIAPDRPIAGAEVDEKPFPLVVEYELHKEVLFRIRERFFVKAILFECFEVQDRGAEASLPVPECEEKGKLYSK